MVLALGRHGRYCCQIVARTSPDLFSKRSAALGRTRQRQHGIGRRWTWIGQTRIPRYRYLHNIPNRPTLNSLAGRLVEPAQKDKGALDNTGKASRWGCLPAIWCAISGTTRSPTSPSTRGRESAPDAGSAQRTSTRTVMRPPSRSMSKAMSGRKSNFNSTRRPARLPRTRLRSRRKDYSRLVRLRSGVFLRRESREIVERRTIGFLRNELAPLTGC